MMAQQRCVCVADLKDRARRRLPKTMFDYIEGGALDETAVRANDQALQALRLKQRVFVDAGQTQLATTMLGQAVSAPVFIAPMGLLSLFHHTGDLGLAEIARKRQIVFMHSSWSGSSVGQVVDVAGRFVWPQVALFSDDSVVDRHLDMAREAGAEVLVLPGDVNVSDKRVRDLHHGLDHLPPRMPLPDLFHFAARPRWVFDYLTRTRMTLGNYAPDGAPLRMGQVKPFLHRMENPSATWETVKRIRRRWHGKLVVKGVMCADDVRLAHEAGIDAVYVSNHGGRQFHEQPGSADVLPQIIDAAPAGMEVYVDGGVTNGGQVIKLIASGAASVGLGRAVAWGLSAGGARGADLAVSMVTDEARTAMGFISASQLSDVGQQSLAVAHG